MVVTTSLQMDRYLEHDPRSRSRRWQAYGIAVFALIAHLLGLIALLPGRADVAGSQPASRRLSVSLVAAPAHRATQGQPAQRATPIPPNQLQHNARKHPEVATVQTPSIRTVQRSAEQLQPVLRVLPVASAVPPQAATASSSPMETADTRPSDAQTGVAPSIALPPKMLGPEGTRELGCRIPQPLYPAKARRLQQAGTVVVKITVGLDGKLSEATILRGSGYELLDAAALEAISSGKCNPYMERGRPEVVQATQPIAFSLDD
jgi:periplasmic protein TonB